MHARTGRTLTALVLAAAALGTGGASVGASADATPRTAAATRTLPPEFSGTMTMTWSETFSSDQVDWTNSFHSEGSASMTAVSGSTIPGHQLVFAVTDLTGTLVLDRGGGDCTYQGTLQPAASPDDNQTLVEWRTPEDGGSPAWSISPFNLVVDREFAPSFCAPPSGVTGRNPLDPLDFGLQIPAVAVPNLDPDGGRFHVVGSAHFGLSEPWVQAYNAALLYPDDYYLTEYDVTLTYDLRRLPPTSSYAQYPTLKLANDARGRDILTVQTRQPVPGVQMWLLRHPPGHADPVIVSYAQYANSRGALRVLLLDRNRTGVRCFQVLVEDNPRTVPGQTLIRCIK